MLFKMKTLEGIRCGEISLAFRRWLKPTVKSGTRLRTAIGALDIVSVEPVGEEAIGDADARAAGYADRVALLAALPAGEGRQIYRIALGGLTADARISLRDEDTFVEDERAKLRARFAAWEKAKPGYFPAILRLIGERPGCRAEDLAAALGAEKLRFKQDVRKLKELGLTESLEVGYRLSPRGQAALALLGS
jgi:DNA-binding transcriptional ArsR family regulator